MFVTERDGTNDRSQAAKLGSSGARETRLLGQDWRKSGIKKYCTVCVVQLEVIRLRLSSIYDR